MFNFPYLPVAPCRFSSTKNIYTGEKHILNRVWLLNLVPNLKYGRWYCAALSFLTVAGLIALQAALDTNATQRYGWPLAIFFCVVIAYVIPVFHFITEHTLKAFDDLTPHLTLDPAIRNSMRLSITHKSLTWVGMTLTVATGLWLFQSWLLSGSLSNMLTQIAASPASFLNSSIPLLVWMTMTTAIAGLTENARVFRQLTFNIDINLLNTNALTPVGRMAVSSTLMVIGAQASFSIMWLGGSTDPWTTIPGLLTTSAALVYLIIAPVWPLHQAIKRAKAEEIALVQTQINTYRRMRQTQDYADITPLLTYRREISRLSEWPLDISVITRLGLYLIIIPLTWVGAALIENVVDFFVG